MSKTPYRKCCDKSIIETVANIFGKDTAGNSIVVSVWVPASHNQSQPYVTKGCPADLEVAGTYVMLKLANGNLVVFDASEWGGISLVSKERVELCDDRD